MNNSNPKPKKKWIIGIFLTLILIAGVGFILYNDFILSSESLYPKPGTYTYWVSVPSVIKSLPKPELIGQARYYHTAGDGTQVPEDEVSFLSTANQKALFQKIEDYLSTKGWNKLKNEINSETRTYIAGDSLIEVKIRLTYQDYNEVIVSKTY